MKRKRKEALLMQLLQGQANQQTLQQLKVQQLDTISIVVCGFRDLQVTDAVEVTTTEGIQHITYAEFQQAPSPYGNVCIQVN
ncbi:hypothetical protein [Spirosoma sp. KNUC1025]|uniref:hypothetical protein n=1 Tax=Spirosoma sp. KNUC1025 TaxID=2894082 RepID=UPI00386E513C|nr:hypothetical protein LN737_05155 [Spirosoma sp. KNUC1025]